MDKPIKHRWVIEISLTDNLLSGQISHYFKIQEDETADSDDLVNMIGDEGIQNLMMDAIVAVIPDKPIILHTPGPGGQTWFKSPKKGLSKRLFEFFVRLYLFLLKIVRFIFGLNNLKFRCQERKIQKYLEREISKVFTDELKKDNIPLLKEDDLGRYYIRLKKDQLPKYLDALGEYGGVLEHYDTVTVPKKQNALLKEDDIKFLADALVFKRNPSSKDENSRIQSIMSDYEIIGILFEGFYYFITHLSDKKSIFEQLNRVAAKYNLITDFDENLL